DSGNLGGSLIVLKQACLELPDKDVVDPRALSGMADTLAAVRREISQLAASRQRTSAITMKELSTEIELCMALLSSAAPDSLTAWMSRLENIKEHALAIDDIVAALSHEHGGEQFSEVRWWSNSLLKESRNY